MKAMSEFLKAIARAISFKLELKPATPAYPLALKLRIAFRLALLLSEACPKGMFARTNLSMCATTMHSLRRFPLIPFLAHCQIVPATTCRS